MSPGLIALLAALAAALLGGAAWRKTNGRMRAPRARKQGAGVVTADAPDRNGAVRLPVVSSGAAAVVLQQTLPGSPAGEVILADPADQKLRLTSELIGEELVTGRRSCSSLRPSARPAGQPGGSWRMWPG